jgi:hypothetical protein
MGLDIGSRVYQALEEMRGLSVERYQHHVTLPDDSKAALITIVPAGAPRIVRNAFPFLGRWLMGRLANRIAKYAGGIAPRHIDNYRMVYHDDTVPDSLPLQKRVVVIDRVLERLLEL